jgi:argininosuccinate lyase
MDVNRAKTEAAASDPMLLATDLADYLVNHGVPFRQAHEVIGKLVAYSISEQRGFGDLTLEEFRKFSTAFEADVLSCLNLETAMQARKGIGAPSPANVKAQLARWRETLTVK